MKFKMLASSSSKLELTDLNENIFKDSPVFNPEEARSLVYILTPKGHNLNKYENDALGQLEINWANYFGDSGQLQVSNFKYKVEVQKASGIEIKQKHDQNMELKLEEPQDMRFEIYNLSKINM